MAGEKDKSQKVRNINTASKKRAVKSVEKKPTSRKNKTDWEILKHEWVTTDVTLSDLANKYELSFTAVRNKYQQQKWSEDLKKYKNYVQEEYDLAMREKARNLASRVTQLDEAVLSASERVIQIVDENLQKVKTAKEVNSLKQISIALKIASEALKNSHYTVRLAGDKATEIVDSRNSHTVDLTDEEKIRIEQELGLIGKSTITQNELLSEGDVSTSMDGTVQPQDTQK
jgi:hypothetical protein